MRITVEADKDIQSIHIVFADNSSAKVTTEKATPNEQPVFDKSAGVLALGNTVQVPVPSTTEPFVVPSTEGRGAAVDEDFAKKQF